MGIEGFHICLMIDSFIRAEGELGEAMIKHLKTFEEHLLLNSIWRRTFVFSLFHRGHRHLLSSRQPGFIPSFLSSCSFLFFRNFLPTFFLKKKKKEKENHEPKNSFFHHPLLFLFFCFLCFFSQLKALRPSWRWFRSPYLKTQSLIHDNFQYHIPFR